MPKYLYEWDIMMRANIVEYLFSRYVLYLRLKYY